MTNKIVLVTSPDDVLLDGIRILVVNLNPDQTSLLSEFFKIKTFDNNIIIYIAKTDDDLDWIIDKKNKADFIIFNADAECDLLNGYLTAQKNSYYFGTLKNLYRVNNNVIFDQEDLKIIFNNI